MWFLRWWPWAFEHGQLGLFTDRLYWPAGISLMWNTSMPALGILLAPLSLSIGPIATLNVAFLLGMTLTGWTSALFVRRWTGGGWPAIAGGWLVPITPYFAGQAGEHLHLAFVPLVPVILLLVDEICIRQRMPVGRVGTLLGLAVAAQILIGEELVATLAVVVTVGLLVAAVLAPSQVRPRISRAVRAGGLAVVVALAVVGYPLWAQFFGPHALRGPVQPPGLFVNDLAGLVVPSRQQLGGGPRPGWVGNTYEWSGYLGIPTLVLLAWVGFRRRFDRRIRIANLLLALVLLLSLGSSLRVDGHRTGVALPWRIFAQWGPLNQVMPARFGLYADLLLGVLFAAAIGEIARIRRSPSQSSAWGPLAVLTLAVISLLPWRAPSSTGPEPAWFSHAARRLPTGSVVWVAPTPNGFSGAAAMRWQALAGMSFASPGGYALAPAGPPGTPGARRVRYRPPATPLMAATLRLQTGGSVPRTSTERVAVRADISRLRINLIVVGPMRYADATRGWFSWLLGRPPDQTAGVAVWQMPSAGSSSPAGPIPR